MAASSASDSSSSSGHRDRKRHGRNRKDKNKDSLKKSRSRTKRRHSSSDSYYSSSSSEDYISSDSEREEVNSSKDTYRKIEPQRRRIKRGKSHRQKRHNHKIKEKQVESSGPVQLSKFLGRDNDDGVRLSAVSGKKILLKLDKTKEDKEAESKRNELLKFLNANYD